MHVCRVLLQKEIKYTYDQPNGPHKFSSKVRFKNLSINFSTVYPNIHLSLFMLSKETGLQCMVFCMNEWMNEIAWFNVRWITRKLV